jgi:integrase
MPRLTKSVPKYRKHRASGQAIVTLDGKDFYLGPYDSHVSRREYDRLVGEWQQNGRRLPAKNDERSLTTVAEILLAYWNFSQGYYVKNGEPTDELPGLKIALRFVRQGYGLTLVSEFGPLALEAVQQRMVEAGHSRKYINKNIGRIKRCFKWGVAKELVPVQVHQALSTVAGLRRGKTNARETAPVAPVDDAVVEKTLPFVPPVVADMIRFQRLTGCRPGELFILRPCDVDREGDVWRYVPGSHKTEHHGRDRVIFVGPKAWAILRPYMLRTADDHCFQRLTGGRFQRWNYAHYINRACDKAFPPPEDLSDEELKAWRKSHRWSPNQLRHTAATEFRRKYGLEAAQVLLGHSTADVTQVYAERDLNKAKEIMGQVG